MFDIKIGLYYCGCFVASCFLNLEKPGGNLVDQQVFTKQGVAVVNATRELLFSIGNEVQGNLQTLRSLFNSTYNVCRRYIGLTDCLKDKISCFF